jgi:hypothetical protein
MLLHDFGAITEIYPSKQRFEENRYLVAFFLFSSLTVVTLSPLLNLQPVSHQWGSKNSWQP